jgi:hypothetical protein
VNHLPLDTIFVILENTLNATGLRLHVSTFCVQIKSRLLRYIVSLELGLSTSYEGGQGIIKSRR